VAAYQASVTELAFLNRRDGDGEVQQRELELLTTLRTSRAEAVRLAGENADAG
jgi:hypothetical protein